MTKRVSVTAAIGLLLVLALGWLLIRGTVIVYDPNHALKRAAVVDYGGEHLLRRMPGGSFVGVPNGDGVVRLWCKNGKSADYGYVTGGLQTRLTVSSCDPLRVTG